MSPSISLPITALVLACFAACVDSSSNNSTANDLQQSKAAKIDLTISSTITSSTQWTAGIANNAARARQQKSAYRVKLTLSFHVYPFGVHVKSCSFYEPKVPFRKMIMKTRTFRFLKTRNRNITSICESGLVLARLRSRNHDQVFRLGRRGPSACKQTAKKTNNNLLCQ